MVASTGTRQQPGLACEECRRRKARCDRVRPTCGICSEMGRQCVVVGTRSQRGPKKGHLKDLRSRVAALEQQLINQTKSIEGLGATPHPSNETTPERDSMDEVDMVNYNTSPEMDMGVDAFHIQMPDTPELFSGLSDKEHEGSPMTPNTFRTSGVQLPTPPVELMVNPMTTSLDGELEISDLMKGELDLLYFERVYPIVPMVHKRRYFSWAGDENPTPARACLRSAMRTVAAAMSAQSPSLGDAMYATTRRMLEMQDAHGETGLPWKPSGGRGQRTQVQHEIIQAWLLLAHFEFVRKPEHQTLLTAGRAFRLLQLSRLLEIDARDNDAPSSDRSSASGSPGPEPSTEDDWILMEEKRRTLWAAFVLDRLYSTLNDRPLMLHEEIICTRLPMPDSDFQDGHQPVRMGFLSDVEGNNDAYCTLNPFAECVVLSNLFRRCIAHRRLAQSITLSGCGEMKSHDFWTRHEWLAAATATATNTRLDSPNYRPRCNPLIAFNRIMAYTASISLSDTAEANPWQTLDDHLLAVTYKQLAYQAALELVRLLKAAPRIAFFKTHPFTPHAVSLVSNFLTVATPPLANSEAERIEGVSVLHRSLRYLSDVHVSARELLQRLVVPRPPSTTMEVPGGTPEWSGVDFAWNDQPKGMGMGMGGLPGGLPFLGEAVW